MKRWFRKRKEDENGAIIVEATIALPIFIFAILIILSVVDICYVQTKMAVALNAAAKEMSQYGYLYTTFGLDEHMSGEGGKSSEFMGSFSEVLNTIGEKTGVVSDELSNLFLTTGNVAGGDSLAEYAKDGLGMVLAKQLVKKNLVSYKDDTAENFLKRNQVVDGADGLNFLYTSFLTNTEQDEVDLVVSYEVRVLKLLNTDFKFRFIQRATSKVWGKGVSLISSDSDAGSSTSSTTQSVWDSGALSRGKSIVAAEKKNYTYTSDTNAFHAYDKDKNQFVRIVSIDTSSGRYADSTTAKDAIKSQLGSTFGSLYSGVGSVQTSVTLQNSTGNDVTVNTPEEGRTYKIVLVVPDNADLNTVKAAAAEFEAYRASLGDTVTVEVKTGYGSPTPVETTTGTGNTEES